MRDQVYSLLIENAILSFVLLYGVYCRCHYGTYQWRVMSHSHVDEIVSTFETFR